MNKVREIPLARFEQPKSNLPLTIMAAILLLLLVAGIVVSISGGNFAAVGLFAGAFAVAVLVGLLYQSAKRSREAVDDRRFIRWDSAMPELQRQNVNVEVRELAKLLGVGNDSLNDLLSAYIVAEDLALRQIQQEENLPLMRHVEIGGSAFDGILVDHDLITCIEVAFLVSPDVRQEKIASMLKKATAAKKKLADQKSRLRLRLMLVLVTQLNSQDEDELRGMLVNKRFTDTPVDIDIRMLDFEMLQRVYLSE
ncbi:MAG TPA: hypothetical protein PKA82_05420 [Pyrinomonadaceae bacterium]|nr:hypothetical protein [Pyrinomonadaceae bacterium]